jgi:hypothetical protein
MKAGSPEIGLLGGKYSNYRQGGQNRDKSHERVERSKMMVDKIVKVSSRLVTDHFVGFCKI